MSDLHAAVRDALEEFRPSAVPPFQTIRDRKRTRDRRRAGLSVATVMGVAAVAAALVVLPIEGQDRLSTNRTLTSAPPTDSRTRMSVGLLRSVQMTGAPGEQPRVVFDPDEVRVGKRIDRTTGEPRDFWTAALAFDALDPGICVSRAVLLMPSSATVGLGAVRAYPSAALSLAQGRVPGNGDPATTLLDNRPFGTETVLADGSRTYDITEIVKLWATGAAFPSQGRSVPARSPVVLQLRPPAADEGDFTVQFDLTRRTPELDLTTCP